jgi:hypothetical protein
MLSARRPTRAYASPSDPAMLDDQFFSSPAQSQTRLEDRDARREVSLGDVHETEAPVGGEQGHPLSHRFGQAHLVS